MEKEKANKSRRLSVRLSNEEWMKIKERADESGMIMSDYVRQVVSSTDGRAGKKKKKLREYREVAAQIARVGNNINQIARWANTYGGAADRAKMMLLLRSALFFLQSVMKSVGRAE